MSSQVMRDARDSGRIVSEKDAARRLLDAGARLRDRGGYLWEIVDGELRYGQSATSIDAQGRPRCPARFDGPYNYAWTALSTSGFTVLREPTPTARTTPALAIGGVTEQPLPVAPPVSLLDWQRAVHANARAKGFYDGAEPSVERVSMQLLLIVTEVAEACEDLRVGGANPETFKPRTTPEGKPIGFGSELSDVAIRVLDLAEFLGIDLEQEIRAKHAYNTRRPHKHGKVF